MSDPKPSAFVWPPRTHDSLPQARPAAGSFSGRPPAISGSDSGHWWQSIERTWLGLVRPSLRERVAESGWTPDELDAFCHRCGVSLLPGQAIHLASGGCSACREHPAPWTQLIRLGRFEGVLRDGVLEAKFERNHAAVKMLGELLAVSLAGAMLSAGRSPDEAVLVPVPTTWWRTFRRGIDHSGRLAEAVGQVLGIPAERGLKRRNGRAQVGLSAETRRRNVHRTMSVRREMAFDRRLVIFVDDVITTGATLRECARAAETVARPTGGGEREVWGLVAAAAEGPGLGL